MKSRPKAAESSSPLSRLPFERMQRIHQLIQKGRYPNAPKIAKEFEVSTKSIHRDLEFMRDRLGLPIEYDQDRHGYFYTEAVGAFPTIEVTEGELLAMVVAEKALQQYRGTNYEKPLMSAFKKMSSSLSDTVSVNIADFEQTISFSTRAEPILNLEIFDALGKAAANRQQLELVYRKPGQRQTEIRVVDPYHLANINGEWYLFGYDHLRNDIRTFVPARIKSLKLTGKRFPRPQRFSLEKRLSSSFGVHSAQGDFRVAIRFNEVVADYIREKKWHHSQELIELDNGGVELRVRLSSLHEIERWILGWGGNAVVLEPRELADMVRRSAGNILKNQE